MMATVSARPADPGRAAAAPERPHTALERLLDELAGVLRTMSAAVYTARAFPSVSGSIGQHVRHLLDHVAAIAATAPPGTVSYDHRERGVDLEADPGVALQAIARLQRVLGGFGRYRDDAPVTLTAILARGGSPVATRSTLGRELLFVISHTVHHQALIAVLLSAVGSSVPEAFGLASSTPLRARD